MKILMIGNKESGKTTYMASAFGLLNDGIKGFYINTDASTRDWFQRLFESIKNGGYPQASDKRDSHKFTLSCQGKNVLDFEWIDYNGGIIQTIDADEFMNDIHSCDGVMLFFDAKALYDNSSSTHQLRRILTLIARKLGNIELPWFSVIIVVTKVDTLNSIEDYNTAIAPLNEFMESTQENEKIYAKIVPVSCTRDGFYNVEIPILDMLDSGLKISYITTAGKMKEYAELAQKYAGQRSIWDWISSKLDGVATYGEMSQAQLAKAQEQFAILKSIEKPMENLSNYVKSYVVTWPHTNIFGKKTKKKINKYIKF